MKPSLHRDSWLHVLHFLDCVEDVVNLSSTCRILFSYVNADWNIWHRLLLDICHSKHLPRLRANLSSLSTSELRAKAIISARLDHTWHKYHQLPPLRTYTDPFDIYAHSVRFLPGGEWLLALSGQGNLQLVCMATYSYRWAKSVAASPGKTVWLNMHLFTISESDSFVLVNGTESLHSIIGIYAIDTLCPAIRPLIIFQTENDIDGCTAESNLLAYGWIAKANDDDFAGGHCVSVARFDHKLGQVTEEITMQLSYKTAADKHGYALRLSDTDSQILISGDNAVALYDIPELISTSNPNSLKPVLVQPIWKFDAAHLLPRAIRVSAHEPIIIAYAHRYMLIDTDPLLGTFIGTYTMTSQLPCLRAISPCRVFWDTDRSIPTRVMPDYIVKMAILPETTRPYDEDEIGNGYYEVDGEFETKQVSMPFETEEPVSHIAWDEESGRLVVISLDKVGKAHLTMAMF